MYLCYDVVRLILEIKYNNWVREKKCICGNEDFKECRLVECYECPNTYCSQQEGFNKWLWDCSRCEETFCGEHSHTLSNNGWRYCFRCILPNIYKRKSISKIECLSDKQMFALFGKGYIPLSKDISK